MGRAEDKVIKQVAATVTVHEHYITIECEDPLITMLIGKLIPGAASVSAASVKYVVIE